MSCAPDTGADARRLDALYRAKAAAEIAEADALVKGATEVASSGDEMADVLLVKGEPGPTDREARRVLAGPDGEAADKALDALEALIAEDHPFLREGAHHVLSRLPGGAMSAPTPSTGGCTSRGSPARVTLGAPPPKLRPRIVSHSAAGSAAAGRVQAGEQSLGDLIGKLQSPDGLAERLQAAEAARCSRRCAHRRATKTRRVRPMRRMKSCCLGRSIVSTERFPWRG